MSFDEEVQGWYNRLEGYERNADIEPQSEVVVADEDGIDWPLTMLARNIDKDKEEGRYYHEYQLNQIGKRN